MRSYGLERSLVEISEKLAWTNTTGRRVSSYCDVKKARFLRRLSVQVINHCYASDKTS